MLTDTKQRGDLQSQGVGSGSRLFDPTLQPIANGMAMSQFVRRWYSVHSAAATVKSSALA